MESTQSECVSASSIPFRSKKPLFTTPKKPLFSSPDPTVETPERSNPVPRVRNRSQIGSDLGSDIPDLVQEQLPSVGVANGSEKSATGLPEKYETLCESFNAMVSSIRLLRLKRLPSTFAKLCRSIESLTDRRFTLHHLAQLTHLVPEVIMVKKIRVQDEETNCMKEELLISLEADSGFSSLKGIFRSRITDYSTIHPEGDDIPEGELPKLFYGPTKDSLPSMNGNPTSITASHISPSFKRRFSSRALSTRALESSPAEPSSCLPETPIKEADFSKAKDESSTTAINMQGTPAKLASTPARLMASTPSLRPPKRALMSPPHDICNLPNKSAKRRCLKFDESSSQVDDDDEFNVPVQSSTASMDVLGVLSEDVLNSVIEKEMRILKEKDPVVSQEKRRQQLVAGVPKLFDMIHLLFQSIRRSVVTKEELIYKIVTGHLDIVDRREVEEQLKLLQEVAPEYISEQLCLSGDILLRLDKYVCPESIRAKLLEAK